MTDLLVYDLLEELLYVTQQLEKNVLEIVNMKNDEEVEMDTWLELLLEREEIMNQLNQIIEQGNTIPANLKSKYLIKVQEIDQKLKPVIEQKKLDVQAKLTKLKMSKKANQQYNNYEFNAYGAFFDKKK